MAGHVDGLALGTIAAGAILGYAGIKGISVTSALRSVVTGKSPATLPVTNPITGGTSGGAGGSGGGPAGPPVTGSGYVGPRKAYLALRSAGFDRSAAIMMTAIGGVESGWSTKAFNNTPATGDLSIGVWQINYYASLGPARTQLLGLTWQQLLGSDVQVQADAARTLYVQAGGFGPWQPDITSGKVLAYWSQATAAAAGGS